MKSFFKIFFATLLSLAVFFIIVIFICFWLISTAVAPSKPTIEKNSVLLLDLSMPFQEQGKNTFFNAVTQQTPSNIPGLYDVVRMLHYAKTDSSIKGLYIKADNNANGFASCEELRQAVADFKMSKKFVIAYGEVIGQSAYNVISVADKIYCHPNGGVEWDGFATSLLFIKDLLDRLEIQPQIFYAGKFKSATEPLRANKMTDANRLQTTVWLNDLYERFLYQVAEGRKADTAFLRNLATQGLIQTPYNALQYRLVDGLKYDDEVKTELFKLIKQPETDKLNLVSFTKYAQAVNYKRLQGKDKIAIVYAEGDIVDGKGNNEQIGSEEFKNLIRKIRMDKEVKALVLRVNSPGGSALASDVIWREIALTRKEKPVVISMGNVAASGGYFISCNADSVFADAGTITGSIGVFGIIPNMQPFFKDKLGITFDGVKTAPYADMGSPTRPLSETEKRFFQQSIDSIYSLFKQRVASGRKKDTAYVDSIAQGRVWTGIRALQIGLVDKIGTLQDAVDCAARLAKTTSYRTREYPEQKTWLEQFMSEPFNIQAKQSVLEQEIGVEQYRLLKKVQQVQTMFYKPQARLPFEVAIH